MKRRTTSLAAGVLAFAALAAPAGASSSYPYAGLGGCSPDVTDTTITPTSASLKFTVPDGCAPQNWLLIVEDYRRNGGAALPADGRTRLVEDRVTAFPGQPVEWSLSSPSRLCGGQVDLVLEGQEQPYAAAVFETADCEDVGTTATPPPAPDNTTPPEGRPSVAGVTDSGGGVGADTAVLAATPANPAPLVQIATQPRIGTLPATLPETGSGQVAQFAFIAAAAIGAGTLMLIGGFVVEWLDRRARVRRIVREQVRR